MATLKARTRHPLGRGRTVDTAGSLFLRSQSGDDVHISPTPVTSSLRATIAQLRLAGDLPSRVGLTSSIRGEGVTFICRSLALVLASDGAKKVCVVDLNWWRPTTWPDSDGESPGLAKVLRRSAPLHQALRATENPNLFVLPAGPSQETDRPILASNPHLSTVLDELDRRFDYVLLDLPAIHPTSEALTLASHAHGVMLVVRHGITLEAQVKSAIEQLDGLPLLGVLLNNYETKVPGIVTRRLPGS